MTTFEGPPLDQVHGLGALTLGSFLGEVVDRFGPAEAFVFDDPLQGGRTVRWSYDDLGARATEVGRALVALDVAPGDAVGIVMGNRPEAVAAIFGAAMAGAVAVPMSTFAPRPELAQMLGRSEPVVVLTQSALLGRRFAQDLDVIGAERAKPIHVAVLGEPSWNEFVGLGGGPDTAAELIARTAAVTPADPALVIFSSGTTSEPKAMLHGHRSPSLQFWLQSQIFGRDRLTRMFSALPLFWTAGLNTAMGSTLAVGGCWVMQETFDPGHALELLSRERVTEPYTLPHQTRALADHPDWTSTDLSTLRCVYGKSAYAGHPGVHGDPSWVMPVGYGLSETSASVSSHRSDTPRELAKVGSGHLLAGTRLRVVDPDSGRSLGVGQEGELAVAGATLMLRYLGATPEQCFDEDGFFHTGDAGHVDEDGVVHFSGRRTEMIKTGGANVSPAEIEVQLRALPSVRMSRVLGVPDDRLDQVVVACIVVADGEEVTEHEVREFLRGRVAPYKVPSRVVFLADGEMPMTDSGTKVRDDALLPLVRTLLDAAPPPSTDMPTTSVPTHSGER